jgi:hypothetical protein
MNTFCKSNGISYEKTVPHSPPQNGVAERTNLTICSMARAMLIDANLRDFFWPFAISTAVHIKQRVPHASLPTHLTPFQLWFGHRPNLSHLRPFGCKCTARILSTQLSKFEPRGETGIFFGYATDAKGYLIWVPNVNGPGGTVKTRRDVVFHDFPNSDPSPDMPSNFLPLWKDVPFPNRLQPPARDSPPSNTTENCVNPLFETPRERRASGNEHPPEKITHDTIPRAVNTERQVPGIEHPAQAPYGETNCLPPNLVRTVQNTGS